MSETPRDFYSDFEVVANTGGDLFYVVIDKATHFGLGIENPVPTILGDDSDLGALSVGDAITVGGVGYEVARPPVRDGEGFLTTVVLKVA